MNININILLTIFLAHFVFFLQAQEKQTAAASFDKITVKGNISVEYYLSDNSEIEVIKGQNADFISYKIKNSKLVLKSKKTGSDQNKSASATIYGGKLKQITVTNGALIKTNNKPLSDTAKIAVSRGGDIYLKAGSRQIDVKVKTGGFLELTGKTETLNLKVIFKGKFRGNKAEIKQAKVKITTGGFAALDTNIEGKVNTFGEIAIYSERKTLNVKKSTKGKVTVNDNSVPSDL